jgi:DNA-binding transcriptional regulator YhcF (GntR family)
MLIVVDPHSGVPVYRQLMDQIKLHVASGMAAPGEELPSTRALSAELGVNPMTVSKAYNLLEREGVVERRPGLPLVVAALALDTAAANQRELLRSSLAPAVTVARQMGVAPEDAVAVFRELLAEAAAPPPPPAPEEPPVS